MKILKLGRALLLAAGGMLTAAAQASLVGHAVTVSAASGATPVASYDTVFQNDGWGYVGGSLSPLYGVNGGLIEQAANGIFFLQVLTDGQGGYRPVSDWRISIDFTDLVNEEISSFQLFRDDFAFADATVSHTARRLDIVLNGNFGFNANAYFGFRVATAPLATEGGGGTVPEPASLALAGVALAAAMVAAGRRRSGPASGRQAASPVPRPQA